MERNGISLPYTKISFTDGFDKEKALMTTCLKSEAGYIENLFMCCVTLCSNKDANK